MCLLGADSLSISTKGLECFFHHPSPNPPKCFLSHQALILKPSLSPPSSKYHKVIPHTSTPNPHKRFLSLQPQILKPSFSLHPQNVNNPTHSKPSLSLQDQILKPSLSHHLQIPTELPSHHKTKSSNFPSDSFPNLHNFLPHPSPKSPETLPLRSSPKAPHI